MKLKNNILNQIMSDNIKGYYLAEVQIRYMMQKMLVMNDQESKDHLEREISKARSVQDIFLAHNRIIEDMLKKKND